MAIPTKLEPLDPSDKSTYEDIKTKITEQALLVLTKTIPDRITTINALYPVIRDPGTLFSTRDLIDHIQLEEHLEKLKFQLEDQLEILSSIKLWLQLSVPKIEDGNNFGVGILEEVINELTKLEDINFNLRENIFKYYCEKAHISSKMVKYPAVKESYAKALADLETKKWMQCKVSFIEIRNSYVCVLDLLGKNWQKVIKPRGTESMMVY